MPNRYGRDYAECIRQFLESENRHFTRDDNKFILPFSASGRQWITVVTYNNANDIICIYSIMPRKAPNARLAQVAEYLTRANYGLLVGNFELDLSDGEIRYKVSIDAEDISEVAGAMRNMMRANLRTFERVCTI